MLRLETSVQAFCLLVWSGIDERRKHFRRERHGEGKSTPCACGELWKNDSSLTCKIPGLRVGLSPRAILPLGDIGEMSGDIFGCCMWGRRKGRGPVVGRGQDATSTGPSERAEMSVLLRLGPSQTPAPLSTVIFHGISELLSSLPVS